jgi:hypothetical protein
MTIRKITSLCALAASLLALPGVGLAGEVSSKDKEVAKVEAPVERRVSGDAGFSVVSQYVSRGVIFENQGAIVQPYADLYFSLYQKEEGFLNKVQLNLGIWNSFHTKETDKGLVSGGNGGPTPYWYEFDFTPGFTFTFAKYFTFNPSYYAFLSPNDGFSTFQGINLKLLIDDSPWLKAFALHPSFTVLFEVDNKAGTGKDEGVYYELAIQPAVPIGPVTLSFPVTAGFGSGNFYGSQRANGTIENEGFGFVSPGVQVDVPLKFIPASYGTWNFTTYYKAYYEGDGTRDFNTAGRGGAVRDGDRWEHVFSGGIGMNF